MRRGSVLLAPAVLVLLAREAVGFAVVGRCPSAGVCGHRAVSPTMGFFDNLKKAFDNQDYSESPSMYEQTNARASHILVKDEAQAKDIKERLAAGTIDFAEAAMQYSTCNSASRGGKLGKFNPGSMVAEFDDVVFGLYDTGELNPKNEAALFKPKYDVDVVHGPIKTSFGYHLILIETRNIAEFDFRLKEEGVVEI